VSRAVADATTVTRQAVEDFLYAEAALLDDWRLDDWLGLLTEDAAYYVPSNDRPTGDHRDTLFMIADDIHRIRARVKRLQDPDAHAEYPRSRTRRMVHNVRITAADGDELEATANFVVYRFHRGRPMREFVGHYVYRLVAGADGLRIRERRAILDSTELGTLGAVSFIL
jgi:p-cumate 2,3-dioxygenase beta subunit